MIALALCFSLAAGLTTQETCPNGAACSDADMDSSPPSFNLLQTGLRVHSADDQGNKQDAAPQCAAGCESCPKGPTLCETCAVGYKFLKTTPPKTTIPSTGCFKKCPDGYFSKPKGSRCLHCTHGGVEGCAKCSFPESSGKGSSSDKQVCLACEKGYALCPTTKSCQKCDAGCTDCSFVDKNKVCHKCKTGFAMNPIKKSCQQCECGGPPCHWDKASKKPKCSHCGKEGSSWGSQKVDDKTRSKCVDPFVFQKSPCEVPLSESECYRFFVSMKSDNVQLHKEHNYNYVSSEAMWTLGDGIGKSRGDDYSYKARIGKAHGCHLWVSSRYYGVKFYPDTTATGPCADGLGGGCVCANPERQDYPVVTKTKPDEPAAKCIDMPGFADSSGYKCSMYSSPSLCAYFSNTPTKGKFKGVTAMRACCSCGGGLKGTTTLYPPPPSIGVKCIDAPGWISGFKSGTLHKALRCSEYKNADWCKYFGNTPTTGPLMGVTAMKACCFCGGGHKLHNTSGDGKAASPTKTEAPKTEAAKKETPETEA